MPRIVITTTWIRPRFVFNLADVNGVLVQDVNGVQITGNSNTNLITTTWI